MSRRFALLSRQGTACSETVLTEAEYNDYEIRARAECAARAAAARDGADAAIPGTWTDVTDNEACQ